MYLSPWDGRAAQARMAPSARHAPEAGVALRPASALCYVFARDGHLHFPLLTRQGHLRHHAGQVAFPGGRPEAGERAEDTAWREAQEELGIQRGRAVELLGRLEPVRIGVSTTIMHVVVALGPDPGPFVCQPEEVVDAHAVPLAELLHDHAPVRADVATARGMRNVPAFRLGPYVVWGATAMALSDLRERLRAADRAPPTSSNNA